MPSDDSLPRGAQHELRTIENVVNGGSCMGTETNECRESRTFRVVPIGEPPFTCSTRNGVTCHLSAGASAPHNQQPHSAGSFGELEELGVRQLPKIQQLRY